MGFHWPKIAPAIIAVICCLNVLYVGWFINSKRRTLTPGIETYSYRAHDFPENLPLPLADLPLVLMTDEESVHYPLLGYDSDEEWYSLTPLDSGSGYLRLGHDNRLFAVSMFHQLHCLRIINLAFSKAPISTPEHIQHCLNYLRQAALCSSDLSIEPGNFEERNFVVERTGATRTCRDWTLVYPVMHENYGRWTNLSF
ncbi:hypothetical protein BDZ97DRAFT_1922310 [Flammula alnicola]|nr:hypothetical protein BDZ97DRAFT_1922310 [Flammula alnicola]